MSICKVEAGRVILGIDFGIKLGPPISNGFNTASAEVILRCNNSDRIGPLSGKLAKIVDPDTVVKADFGVYDENTYTNAIDLRGSAINDDPLVRKYLRWVNH